MYADLRVSFSSSDPLYVSSNDLMSSIVTFLKSRRQYSVQSRSYIAITYVPHNGLIINFKDKLTLIVMINNAKQA